MAKCNITDEQRFWAKVQKSEGCWLWIAGRTSHGYGVFWFRGRLVLAHRVAWILTHGDIPYSDNRLDWCVLHRCDTPACVNPSHLFLGNHSDNMRDMVSKNRHNTTHRSRGEHRTLAKLTESQVRAIRIDARSQRAIALDYAVSQHTICCIRRRETWRHVS